MASNSLSESDAKCRDSWETDGFTPRLSCKADVEDSDREAKYVRAEGISTVSQESLALTQCVGAFPCKDALERDA